jgi:hypothetical protein
MTTLPNDIARCGGTGVDGERWEDCETCLRRTSPGGDDTPWIEPPDVIPFECEYLIEPENNP